MQLDQFSEVAKSCNYTAAAASKFDKRQLPSHRPYTVQSESKRLLDAKLILEEAMETIHALGFNVVQTIGLEEGLLPKLTLTYDLIPNGEKPDIEKIIDGCCDTIYVATGCLNRMCVPDTPHLQAVCVANNAKFPNGKATIDKVSGKYLKPVGWKPPDHKSLIKKGRVTHVKRKKVE